MIKLKPDVMNLLQPLLMSGEQVQAAVAFGRLTYSPEVKLHIKDRDYLLITDQRLLCIKGEWFETKQGLTSYPREMISCVDVSNYLLGCTVTITIKPPVGEPRQLQFPNCSKPEGDAIRLMFAEQLCGKRCPSCGHALRADFTFCPFCKANLKRICRTCGKPQEEDWKNCPFCGN